MSGKNVTKVVPADTVGLARAARILESGGIIAVPTETVYGLAARADSAVAVAKIYAAKGRPDFNPLIVHVRDAEHAQEIAEFGDAALKLARMFWPGPLSLVLPLKPNAGIAKAVTAGLPNIALRSPKHPVMRAVLRETGLALAAPSANRSEHISPTNADHVTASLACKCPLVLDGGASECGVESTIVALRNNGGWSLLRPGPIGKEVLIELLGPESDVSKVGVEAPGQMARHYSPGKPVRLNRETTHPGDFMIGFGDIPGDVNLSKSGDKNEAAARLYDCLHQAESAPNAGVSVAPIGSDGIGRAINDRLCRAATPLD